MLPVLFLATLLALCGASAARAGDDLAGLAAGFRGLAWGTALTDLPEMRRVQTGEKTFRNYVLVNEAPTFAGVPVKRVLYGFVNAKLARVVLEIDGLEPVAALFRVLFQNLGPPSANRIDDRDNVSVWRLGPLEVSARSLDAEKQARAAFVSLPTMRRAGVATW